MKASLRFPKDEKGVTIQIPPYDPRMLVGKIKDSPTWKALQEDVKKGTYRKYTFTLANLENPRFYVLVHAETLPPDEMHVRPHIHFSSNFPDINAALNTSPRFPL